MARDAGLALGVAPSTALGTLPESIRITFEGPRHRVSRAAAPCMNDAHRDGGAARDGPLARGLHSGRCGHHANLRTTVPVIVPRMREGVETEPRPFDEQTPGCVVSVLNPNRGI